jgi:hypothetical protein
MFVINLTRSLCSSCAALAALLFLISTGRADAATWTALTRAAPGSTGVMLQLTDGSVIVQNNDNLRTWMKLTPDANGSYINGTWSTTAPMSVARLYFASNVLRNGNLWVLGGEYTAPTNAFSNWSNTGEIFNTLTNTWSPIAPYPNQPGCPQINTIGGSITTGSNLVTDVYPQTAGLLGKTIVGPGIPGGTTITSIVSATQIHISHNATSTIANGLLNLTTKYTLTGCFGDDPSMLLPGGTAGRILAGDLINGKTFLYDVGSDSWSPTGTKVYTPESSDEEGWAKLGDGTVLTYDLFKSIATGGSYAERYHPGTGTWAGISPSDGSALGTIPQLSSVDLGYELGPLLRLQDGRILVIGANQHTALYKPSTNTWSKGPDIIGSLNGHAAPFGADDAPAAILPNGHVILAADAGPSPVNTTGSVTAGSKIITHIPSTALFQKYWYVTGLGIPANAYITSVDSPTQVHINFAATATATGDELTFGGLFSNPVQLFDFNPATNAIAPVSPAIPDANLPDTPAFVTRMLILPTGQLLFSDSGNQLYIYTPDGAADPSLRPVVNSVTFTSHRTFRLTGMQLNGQSAGSSYGDDVESDSNYPIVRLTNGAGKVFYARTTNWSSFGVGGGTTTQTVTFTLNPEMMTAGTYALTVSGAGIMSNPFTVSITPTELQP